MSKPWDQGHSNFSSVHGRDLNGAGKRPRGGGWGDLENQNTAPQTSSGWPSANAGRWKAQRRHRALPNRPRYPSARARPHQGSRGLTLNFNYWNKSPFYHQILVSGIRQWVVSVFSRKDTPAFLETSQRAKKVVLVNVFGLDMSAAEETMEMEKCPFLGSCTSVPVRNTLDESDAVSRGTDVHTSGALMLWGEKPVLLSPQELTPMSLPELLRSCETNISIPRTAHWADVISFIPSSRLEESTATTKSGSAGAGTDDDDESPESARHVVCTGHIWKNGCLDRGKFTLVSIAARGGMNEQWRSSTALRHRGQVDHLKSWQSWKLVLKWSGKGNTKEDFNLRVADTDGDGLRLMDEKTGLVLSVMCARRTSEEDILLSPGRDAPGVIKIVVGSDDAATSSAMKDDSSPAKAPSVEPMEAEPSDAEHKEGVNGGEAHTVDVRLEELRPDAFALSEADRRRLGIPVKLEDRTFVSSGPVELQSTTSEDSGSSDDEEEHVPQSKARRKGPEGVSSIDDEVEEGELCFTSGEGTQAVKSDAEQQVKNYRSWSTQQPPSSPPSTPKSARSTESAAEKCPLTTLENSEPEDGEVCEDHERESEMEDGELPADEAPLATEGKTEASHVDGDGAASGDAAVVPGLGTKPKCFVPPSKDALCPVSCGPAKGSVLLGMDCEMVQTEQGQAVARVTLVNIHGETMYDELVKPRSKVTDFLSRFSGIQPGMLRGVKRTLEDVQRELLLFIDQDTYLVGHAIVNDLRGLKLIHRRVIDTAELYPSPKGAPFTMGLKALAQSFLGRTIQESAAGHDSKQDAFTALELALLKMGRGPEFGLPPAWGSFPCPSRQTLFDDLASAGLAPLGCRVIGETEHQSSAPGDNYGTPQPWSIFKEGYRREEDAVWTARHFCKNTQEGKGTGTGGQALGSSNGESSPKGCVTLDASEHASAREMLAAAMEAVKTGPDLVWVDAPCKDTGVGYSRRSGSACQGKQWNSLREVDESMRSLFDCLEEGTAMAIVCQGSVSKMRRLLAKKKAAHWAKSDHNPSIAGIKRNRDAAFDKQKEEQLSVLTDDCLNVGVLQHFTSGKSIAFQLGKFNPALRFHDGVFLLKIRCDLDNVAAMTADKNNKWIITVKTPDQSERREHVEITRARDEELVGSRGTANLVIKWPGAKKQATASIVDVKKVTTGGEIKGSQSGEYVPVLGLDCRGMEPEKWHPSTDFTVTSEGDTVFETVDLSEGDWTDYCEKSAAPVSILDVDHKFEAV